MNAEWVKKKSEKEHMRHSAQFEKLKSFINSSPLYDGGVRETVLARMNEFEGKPSLENESIFRDSMMIVQIKIMNNPEFIGNDELRKVFSRAVDIVDRLPREVIEQELEKESSIDFHDYVASVRGIHYYERFLDSPKMEFHGNIVITDPGYFIDGDGDWEKTEYGIRLDRIGMKNYISRDTLEGDWACSIINTYTGCCIGRFGADAGKVCIADMSEVLEYNPSFKDWVQNHGECVAVIKNFDGEAQMIVDCTNENMPEVHVVGHGSPFSFESRPYIIQ